MSILFSILIVITIICLPQVKAASGAYWSYNETDAAGPTNWGASYPTCNSKSQSPVDVAASASTALKLPNFEFSPDYAKDQTTKLLLKNNGHTIQLDVNNSALWVKGGGLGSKYTLVQFHLHWGNSDDVGSEHQFEGKSSPLEIHHVHYDSERFNNISEALSSSNGLAVFGTLFKISTHNNSDIDKIVKLLPLVQTSGSNTSAVDAINLSNLISPNRNSYFRYNGSLTTPGCIEAVTWTVFTEPLSISTAQLNEFRKLSIGNNFRPVQSLNGRRIYKVSSSASSNFGFFGSFFVVVCCLVASLLPPID